MKRWVIWIEKTKNVYRTKKKGKKEKKKMRRKRWHVCSFSNDSTRLQLLVCFHYKSTSLVIFPKPHHHTTPTSILTCEKYRASMGDYTEDHQSPLVQCSHSSDEESQELTHRTGMLSYLLLMTNLGFPILLEFDRVVIRRSVFKYGVQGPYGRRLLI